MATTIISNPTNFFETAASFITISKERAQLLNTMAIKIANVYKAKEEVNLNFICTHNSRRSQLGQVWTFFAASYFKLQNMNAFSGGTEVTAFHRNTVKTLQRVGFIFNVINFNHQNPHYNIHFDGAKNSIIGFSKVYDDVTNTTPFIAITTCSSADENCPFIPEAIHRFHLPFVDPKMADETDQQEETYLATNRQIAAEVFLIFKKVKELVC